MGFTRLAGFAAFGFAAIVLGLNAVLESTTPPAGDATAAEVAGYFTENSNLVRTGVLLAVLAWVCIAVFAAGALARQSGQAWSMVGVIGVVMQTVLFAAVSATRLALTFGAPADATTSLLWHLHNTLFMTNSVGLVLTLTGFSLGGLRSATLRPWHGAVGLTSAALLLAGTVLGVYTADGGGPAGLTVIGLVGWLLWVFWLATFGVVLVRETSPATTGRVAPVPAR